VTFRPNINEGAHGYVHELPGRHWRAANRRLKPPKNIPIHKLGFKGEQTGHCFRGIADTMLREMGYDHQVVEKQMAHKVKDDTERAYNKALFIEQRTTMMQAWADFLEEARNTAKLPAYKQFLRQ
jgi:integrase